MSQAAIKRCSAHAGGSAKLGCTRRSGSKIKRTKGRWTNEEHESFLRGIDRYGKDWIALREFFVPTRTDTQIRTHAQKYFKKKDAGVIFPKEPYLPGKSVPAEPSAAAMASVDNHDQQASTNGSSSGGAGGSGDAHVDAHSNCDPPQDPSPQAFPAVNHPTFPSGVESSGDGGHTPPGRGFHETPLPPITPPAQPEGSRSPAQSDESRSTGLWGERSSLPGGNLGGGVEAPPRRIATAGDGQDVAPPRRVADNSLGAGAHSSAMEWLGRISFDPADGWGGSRGQTSPPSDLDDEEIQRLFLCEDHFGIL